jgi:hypothetical protein
MDVVENINLVNPSSSKSGLDEDEIPTDAELSDGDFEMDDVLSNSSEPEMDSDEDPQTYNLDDEFSNFSVHDS